MSRTNGTRLSVRDRIRRLYEAHPEGASTSGATGAIPDYGQTWLARREGLAPSTVRRWVQADRLSRAGEEILRRLEREAEVE